MLRFRKLLLFYSFAGLFWHCTSTHLFSCRFSSSKLSYRNVCSNAQGSDWWSWGNSSIQLLFSRRFLSCQVIKRKRLEDVYQQSTSMAELWCLWNKQFSGSINQVSVKSKNGWNVCFTLQHSVMCDVVIIVNFNLIFLGPNAIVQYIVTAKMGKIAGCYFTITDCVIICTVE